MNLVIKNLSSINEKDHPREAVINSLNILKLENYYFFLLLLLFFRFVFQEGELVKFCEEWIGKIFELAIKGFNS